MPIYGAGLFDVMKAHGTHESILAHKFRLFRDMVYGDKRILDEEGRVRLDHLEMDETIQAETDQLMNSLSDEDIMNLPGTKTFLQEFYQINGFEIDGIDYDLDVDIDQYIATYVPEELLR